MKKYLVLFMLTFMLVAAGCQSRDINQEKGVPAEPSQNVTIAAPDTVSDSTKETANQNTENTSVGNEQKSTTAAGDSSSSAQNKKAEAAGTKAASKPKEDQKQPETASFTLLISKNKGTEEVLKKKLQIEPDKSLLDYLRDNVSVVDDGGFIKSIEGFEAVTSKDLTTEQKNAGIMGIDWFIYQNGVKTRSGAGDIVPKNGDMINLDYREWTYKDMAP